MMVKNSMNEIKIKASKYEKFLSYAIRDVSRIEPKMLLGSYEVLDDHKLFEIAKINEVESIVASALISHQIAGVQLASHWRSAHSEMEQKITEYMKELDRLAETFSHQGIPLIALKNSGIARGIYKYYGASPMGDLDLLIEKDNFYKAHNLLESLDYRLKFRSKYEKEDITEAFSNGSAEYIYTLTTGAKLWVEIQWRPIAGRWIQDTQEPKGADLFFASKSVDDSYVRILCPEDNLLQVCLHTAKHSYVRSPGFRLHTDVERIVSREEIDWALFINKVETLNIKTAVYFSLALCKSLLHTDIPNDILNRLRPPKWKKIVISYWLNKNNIFNPNEKKWTNVGYIVFVSLLYDRKRDLFNAIFPKISEMKKNTGYVNFLSLPFLYLKRIISLITKRTGI